MCMWYESSSVISEERNFLYLPHTVEGDVQYWINDFDFLCSLIQASLAVGIQRSATRVCVISRMSARDWKIFSSNPSKSIVRLLRRARVNLCISKTLEWYLIIQDMYQVKYLKWLDLDLAGYSSRAGCTKLEIRFSPLKYSPFIQQYQYS